jgi:hypothetical protein
MRIPSKISWLRARTTRIEPLFGVVIFLSFAGCGWYISSIEQVKAAMTDRKSSLTVTLSLKVKKGEPVLARIQFFNGTDQAYQLLSWLTFPTGHIDSKNYLSVQINDQNARYIGMLKKRAAPTAADYISVRPGETVTSIVSLSEAYAIGNSGILAVTYSAINPSLADDDHGDHLNSNTVSVRLD